MIKESQRLQLYHGKQSEIIAKPGDKRAMLEFMVVGADFNVTKFGKLEALP
jgi:hypothetical protein